VSRPHEPLPRLFVSGMIIDALGSGMFMPFALLFFIRVQDLTVASVGTTLTVVNVALIAASAAVGRLVQSLGSMQALTLGNAIRVPLFVLYTVKLPAPVAMGALVLSTVLDKAVWVSLGATIARLANGTAARHAYSTVGWARNIGLCLGALFGGLLAASHSTMGLRAIALVNATSFAACAVLLLKLRETVSTAASFREQEDQPVASSVGVGTLQILRLPGFALLSAAKTCFAICATLISMFTGLYLVDRLQMDGWVAGTVLALNGALVVLFQQPLVKRTSERSASEMMLTGGILYAAAGIGFALLSPLQGSPLPLIATTIALMGMTIYTLGEIIIAPASDGLAADLAAPGIEAPCMSVYQASWSIASVVAPLAGAWLILAPAFAFWGAFLTVALLGSLLSAMLGRERLGSAFPESQQ
jgi:MFS family permease